MVAHQGCQNANDPVSGSHQTRLFVEAPCNLTESGDELVCAHYPRLTAQCLRTLTICRGFGVTAPKTPRRLPTQVVNEKTLSFAIGITLSASPCDFTDLTLKQLAGENPQIVRAVLRWTNLNMLAHYTHGFRSDKLEALGAVLDSHLRHAEDFLVAAVGSLPWRVCFRESVARLAVCFGGCCDITNSAKYRGVRAKCERSVAYLVMLPVVLRQNLAHLWNQSINQPPTFEPSGKILP